MTCWEMAWLVKHGRIVLQLPVSDWLDQAEANGVAIIPVSRSIAERAVSLPEHHKAPVDRIIIAKWIDFFVLHKPITPERITRRLK
ncbi:MAG: hypothetical protein Q8P42_10085 [Gallionella sp.]|nr:hypothetical protein [Gallionella sp.]